MPIRITQKNQGNSTGENTDPKGYETTYDGQTFFWAPGQKRSFGDIGQGLGHSLNSSPTVAVLEDGLLSKKYQADTFPSRS